MHAAAILGGCLAVVLILTDVFKTIIMARRSRRSLFITKGFYRATWRPFSAIGKRIKSSEKREDFLSIYGPLSLVLILALWAAGLIAAFGFVQWGAGLRPGGRPSTLGNDLYLSATTLFTLESGDPQDKLSKLVTAAEAALGFSMLGMVVAYLPLFYQAFSKREIEISLLDARGGSPPSAMGLLQAPVSEAERVERTLEGWERWAAEVLENHLSYPMMTLFRSHHSNQSWLSALTAITDCTAVMSLCAEGDLQTQARFTFAMGRHALADLATILHLDAVTAKERLPAEAYERLRQAVEVGALPLNAALLTEDGLAELRRMYEPQAAALSGFLAMDLPPWAPERASGKNWKGSKDVFENKPGA